MDVDDLPSLDTLITAAAAVPAPVVAKDEDADLDALLAIMKRADSEGTRVFDDPAARALVTRMQPYFPAVPAPIDPASLFPGKSLLGMDASSSDEDEPPPLQESSDDEERGRS